MKTIDKLIYIYGATSVFGALYKSMKDLKAEERKQKNKISSELSNLNKEVFKIIISGKDCDHIEMHEFKDFIDKNFEEFKLMSNQLIKNKK